jgi:hypothetical protein
MEKRELLKKKIYEGFVPCFNDGCQRHEHCLRWQARECVNNVPWVTTCINPANPEASGDTCIMYRDDQLVRMAYGFTKLLDELPKKAGRSLMATVIGQHNRTYAYEYRNGSRPIPPAMQDDIADTCRRLGYTAPVVFDRYAEDYEW